MGRWAGQHGVSSSPPHAGEHGTRPAKGNARGERATGTSPMGRPPSKHQTPIGVAVPLAEQMRRYQHCRAALRGGACAVPHCRKRRQCGSRLSPGSSSTSTGASGNESTAKASRWRVPPDNRPVACDTAPDSPHCDSTAPTRPQAGGAAAHRTRGSPRRSALRGSAAPAAGTRAARAPPCATTRGRSRR